VPDDERRAVGLIWSAEDFSRGSTQAAGWYVIEPGFQTDPEGPWYQHHNKFFPKADLDLAKQWVAAAYGYEELIPIPGFPRCLFPKWVEEWAVELLKTLPEPQALKVYGYRSYEALAPVLYAGVSNRQVRAIVAAKSLAEVARITGMNAYQVRNEGQWTGSEDEISTALSEPGVIFWRPNSAVEGTSWTKKEKNS
jgi:hypothetical protein